MGDVGLLSAAWCTGQCVYVSGSDVTQMLPSRTAPCFPSASSLSAARRASPARCSNATRAQQLDDVACLPRSRSNTAVLSCRPAPPFALHRTKMLPVVYPMTPSSRLGRVGSAPCFPVLALLVLLTLAGLSPLVSGAKYPAFSLVPTTTPFTGRYGAFVFEWFGRL